MDKKIALLLGEITGDFQEKIMRAVKNRANELGYKTIAFCSYGSYNNDMHFANGEKACAYIMDYNSFDGIILSEDLFDLEGMPDELYSHLKENVTCPIVYMRTKREGCFSILVENTNSMKKMTNHFIKDHGFTDIVYMSGKKDSLDSEERLVGFLSAMEEAGLPVNDHSIFYGDFWREKGRVAVDFFMEGRTEYPQAVICANDYMALSIIEELTNRGVRVPQDVCVSGYDYIDEARLNQPSITSLAVDFVEMAKEAVNIIDRVNMAIHQDKITLLEPNIMLHNSCGCGEQWQFKDMMKLLQRDYHHIYSMKNHMLATMEYQDAFEEDEYLEVADKYFDCLKVEKAWLCLFDYDSEEVKHEKSITKFPNKMVLKRILNNGINSEKTNIPFERQTLLPVEYLNDEDTENLLVFSLHFKNHLYGYLVVKFPEKDWFDIFSQAYILNLATALENASVQKELNSFEQIKELYQKDSLTGLYNRRGYDRQSRDLLKKAEKDNTELIFVSADLDRLKYINDTFGHTEGDKAIRNIADAISNALEPGEIAARMGGDEFFAILIRKYSDRGDKFTKSVNEYIAKCNEKNPMYPIDVSLGMIYSEEYSGTSIQYLMHNADIEMYNNKKNKAVQRVN